MKKALPSDKEKVIRILEKSFYDVPGLVWITGGGLSHNRKLRTLLDCAVELTFHQGEIWLSDNERAAMLLFYQHDRRFSWRSIWLKLRMATQVIGLARLPEILARERYIQAQQTHANCIYVWFIAALDDSLDGVVDLKNAIFQKSYLENLPILMETTVRKVALAFERYGFMRYHHWQPTHREVQVWFLRRAPSAKGITQPTDHSLAVA